MILAWAPTPEFWALLTLIASGVMKFLYEIHKDRKAEKLRDQAMRVSISEREQARLDLAAVAALTVEQLDSVKTRIAAVDESVQRSIAVVDANGQDRLKKLISSNVTTRAFTKKAIDTATVAIDTANNVNAKIAALGQTLVDQGNTPQDVRVVNTPQDPVPVETARE